MTGAARIYASNCGRVMPQLSIIDEQDISGLQDASKNGMEPVVINQAHPSIDVGSVDAEDRQLLYAVLMGPFADGWRGSVIIGNHALTLKQDFSTGVDPGSAGEDFDERRERCDVTRGDFRVGPRCAASVGTGIDWMKEVSVGRFDHVPAADKKSYDIFEATAVVDEGVERHLTEAMLDIVQGDERCNVELGVERAIEHVKFSLRYSGCWACIGKEDGLGPPGQRCSFLCN
jgi:hypothetical protein